MNKAFKFERERIRRNLVLDGIMVGLVSGFASLSYRYILTILDDIRGKLYIFDLKHIIFLAILAVLVGLTMGRILKWEPLSSGSGIPQVQGEILGYFKMKPLRVLFAKIFAGSLGNFIGMSLGREGPSIQIGAASGKLIAKLLKKNPNEERYMISSGASAGLSAAFNAPLAGTLFTLEEMHRNFSPLLFIPSVMAAVIADFLSKNVFGLMPVFNFSLQKSLALDYYWLVIIIGLSTALVGSIFSTLILKGQDIYRSLHIKGEYHPLLAALVTLFVGFSFYDLLGGGHHLIETISLGKFTLISLILILIGKLLFTVVCFSSGAQGGIFLPLLVLGGITGAILYELFSSIVPVEGNYLSNFIIIAMAGILTAVVRSPILSIILVTEMTGSTSHLLSLTLVSLVAYLTCEYFKIKPIYESLLIRQIEARGNNKGEEIDHIRDKIIESFVVGPGSLIKDKVIKDIDFPKEVLLINIRRQEEEIVPKGDTLIKAGDEVSFIMRDRDLKAIRDML